MRSFEAVSRASCPGYNGLPPFTHRTKPEVIAMAGDNNSNTAGNPTQCVAATASEARRYSPSALKVDKPQNNPSDPAGFDYAERFLP